jgi:excisionase family DNA binding protein
VTAASFVVSQFEVVSTSRAPVKWVDIQGERWNVQNRPPCNVPSVSKLLNNDRRLLHSPVKPMARLDTEAPWRCHRRIMTVAEVAEYFNVGRNTIYRLARNGKVPAFKIGTDWRFDRGAIEKLVTDRQVNR